MGEDGTYSMDEAMRAMAVLRRAAGLPEERFAVAALVGMLSDEIETLRGQGRTDEEIAGMVREGAGVEVSGEELRQFYATPEERGRGGERG